MLENKYNKGFTLIEIVAILILIGILMAVAASKYFDMRDEAQKRAALATVAEAQSRINSVFAEKILGGETCANAKAHASDLDNIDDMKVAQGNAFGDYYLSLVTGTEGTDSGALKVDVGLISESTTTTITSATLYLPECGSKDGGSGGSGDGDNTGDGDETTGDWYLSSLEIRQKYGDKFAWEDFAWWSDDYAGHIVWDPLSNEYKVWNRTMFSAYKLSNADNKENWVKFDSEQRVWMKFDSENNTWVNKLPVRGTFYKGNDGEVYIYEGGFGTPSEPSEDSSNWLKLVTK